jgi:hypothetical protein
MNYFVHNLDTDFDYSKLIIGKKINIDENISRYYLYYLDKDKRPKDFYVKMPSIRLLYSYKNNKYNQIKLPLFPMYDETKKLITFLKKLKIYVEENIKSNKKFNNYLEKKENLKLLKLHLANDLKIKNKNDNLSINDLSINSEIQGIINIPYIWENEINIGLTIIISKIYYYPKIESELLFIDDDYNYTNTKQIIQNNNFNQKNSFNQNQNKNRPSFKLTDSLLIEMKNKIFNKNKL